MNLHDFKVGDAVMVDSEDDREKGVVQAILPDGRYLVRIGTEDIDCEAELVWTADEPNSGPDCTASTQKDPCQHTALGHCTVEGCPNNSAACPWTGA